MKTKNLPNYRKIIYKLRWSPEIEVEFPQKIDIDKLHKRYDKFLGGWKVTTDSSLNNGLEFKPKNSHKLYYNSESFEEIREIFHLIRGHKAKVTTKCGLHIHIDAKLFADEQIVKIIKDFIRRQRYIVKKFKVNKDRLKDMCKLLPRNGLSKITSEAIHKVKTSDSWNLPDYPYFQDKHFALNILNLKNYGSLEFRLFEATMKVKEIKEIVKWLFEFLINALETD